MQMVNQDQSQEGETIPKDVWGAGETKMSLCKVFLHRIFVVCGARARAGKFKIIGINESNHC